MQHFRFDASADTMVAQADPELEYYEQITNVFGESPFLVLTYTPHSGTLFTTEHIANIAQLSKELEKVESVVGVFSILDAPLLESPAVPLAELAEGYRTLRSQDVVFELAQKELSTSPLFEELVVSTDGRSTAIRIDLSSDAELDKARELRDYLLETQEADAKELALAQTQYLALSDNAKLREAQAISAVREIRDRFAGDAQLHLGGVPMIRSDMVTFVKEDMTIFGVVIIVLLASCLMYFFKRLRWVLIPLGTTAVTILLTMGVLAWLGQPVTAISSSFIALIAIITISFSVHLLTEYREIYSRPDIQSQCEIAYETMRAKFAPCVYTALTTGVAFASLLTSDIVPVIDFGWMMIIGICISLTVTYSFFASVLVLLSKNEICSQLKVTPRLTQWFARQSVNNPLSIILVSVMVAITAIVGGQQLELGSRVVEYFRGDTEIRQGLDFIDRNLGGTIPIDIVLEFKPYEAEQSEEDSFFDEEEADNYPQRFWFTPEKISVVDKIHQYLESQPEIGKVVSLASLERVGRSLNDNTPLNYLQLTAILGAVPDDIRASLIAPYASPETGQVRISARLHETGPAYDLKELIRGIKTHATDEVMVTADAVRVTGIAVLFNDMLDQLIDSQLSTLLFVLFATFVMIALSLRSLSLALIGLLPNVIAAISILGIMGFLGIPLDMMTITIAAIVIGIGVDDAIHYLHRFKSEYSERQSATEAVLATHNSTGKALYFTSLTVVVGFSVLLFSRFVPTAYFGWLTALAMVLALTANLSLLPALLVKVYRS